MKPCLEVAVVRDPQAFAALEEEWDDLYRYCPRATPFQSWAWLYTWWEYYGEGHELRLITVRHEGLLVGIIPLMLKRRWSLGRLLFVGTGLSDYLDVIVRAGWEDKVLESGVQALKELVCWHIVDLQQLRPEAAAWDIRRWWDGPRIRLWQDSCPIIEVKPWDELLMSIKNSNAATPVEPSGEPKRTAFAACWQGWRTLNGRPVGWSPCIK